MKAASSSSAVCHVDENCSLLVDFHGAELISEYGSVANCIRLGLGFDLGCNRLEFIEPCTP